MKLKENAFVRNTRHFHKEFYRPCSEVLEGMKVVHIEAQHFFSSSRLVSLDSLSTNLA